MTTRRPRHPRSAHRCSAPRRTGWALLLDVVEPAQVVGTRLAPPSTSSPARLASTPESATSRSAHASGDRSPTPAAPRCDRPARATRRGPRSPRRRRRPSVAPPADQLADLVTRRSRQLHVGRIDVRLGQPGRGRSTAPAARDQPSPLLGPGHLGVVEPRLLGHPLHDLLVDVPNPSCDATARPMSCRHPRHAICTRPDSSWTSYRILVIPSSPRRRATVGRALTVARPARERRCRTGAYHHGRATQPSRRGSPEADHPPVAAPRPGTHQSDRPPRGGRSASRRR